MVTLLAREAQVSSLEKMLSHDVLYSKPWPGAQIVLGVSCGYFAYDQWDMLQKHLYNPRSPSLLIHHAVLLTCFTPAIYLNRCINYLILTLVCEVCIGICHSVNRYAVIVLQFYSSLPDSTELIENGTANGHLAMVVGSKPLHV